MAKKKYSTFVQEYWETKLINLNYKQQLGNLQHDLSKKKKAPKK